MPMKGLRRNDAAMKTRSWYFKITHHTFAENRHKIINSCFKKFETAILLQGYHCL